MDPKRDMIVCNYSHINHLSVFHPTLPYLCLTGITVSDKPRPPHRTVLPACYRNPTCCNSVPTAGAGVGSFQPIPSFNPSTLGERTILSVCPLKFRLPNAVGCHSQSDQWSLSTRRTWWAIAKQVSFYIVSFIKNPREFYCLLSQSNWWYNLDLWREGGIMKWAEILQVLRNPRGKFCVC